MKQNTQDKLYKIKGRIVGADFPVATLILWIIAFVLLASGMVSLLPKLFSAADGSFYAGGSLAGTFVLPALAFGWGYVLRNPNSFIDIRDDGFWLFNKQTRLIQSTPLWIEWDQVKDAKRASFGINVDIELKKGKKISTGYFPGLAKGFVAFIKSYRWNINS